MTDITKSCANCAHHYQNGKRCDARPCHQGSEWELSKECDYIDQIEKLMAQNKELENRLSEAISNQKEYYDPLEGGMKHFQD